MLFVPFLTCAQQTYIPDDNFEAFLEANGMGNGIPNDDYVTTSNINTVISLFAGSQNISDLTGIEDFNALDTLICNSNLLTSLNISQNSTLDFLNCRNNQLSSLDITQNLDLKSLICDENQLTSLDVTQNSNLQALDCANNQLTYIDLTQNSDLYLLYGSYNMITTLDVSQNLALTYLTCTENQLTSIDLTQNSSLSQFWCAWNQLTSIDTRQNPVLTELACSYNQLECLNMKSGGNTNITYFTAIGNPNLICIEVDDVGYSTSNWTNIDAQTLFSSACANPCNLGIDEVFNTTKELIKIVDLMGRETEDKPNTMLIYIYSDGTTEKVYRIE